MLSTNPIDPHTVGRRLTEARKARRLTQEEVCAHLGCSRPTLIAIEKGERPAKPDELVRLVSLYGRRMHEIVRTGELVTDFQPHLRAVAERMKTGSKDLDEAIAEFRRFVEDYCELERIMEAPLRPNYPPEVELSGRVDVWGLAEDVATMERNRLGLGDQPIINLRSVLEWDVGVRIFFQPLPSAVAGMFAFDAEAGCSIVINIKHPPERRRASTSHEYGHLSVDRYKPAIDYVSTRGRKPANESFAEAFGMAFLMPATGVRRRFHEITRTTGDFRVADLCRLANSYFVSVEAMTLRLEELGLIRKGSRTHLKESDFKARKAAELLELPSHPASDEPYPERYKLLAVQAHELGKISEGELARFLRCDRVTAREIVAQCLTNPEGEQRGLPRNFQQSLLA